MACKMIGMFFKKARLLALAIIVLGAMAAGRVARAQTTVNVASDPAQGSPFEVGKNQLSTLTYNVTWTVGADSEGVTPSVKSITLTFTAGNGAVLANGKTTETETLSQGIYSGMPVSCQSSADTYGNCYVHCGVVLNLSDDGNPQSNVAGDAFEVQQMTVNISGPPYIIIDNSKPYDYALVKSSYTADVNGEPDPNNLSYTWTVPTNIHMDYQYGGDATAVFYGLSQPGPASVQVAVDDGTAQQVGLLQVTVENEYTVIMNPTPKVVYGIWVALPPEQIEPATGGVPLSWTVGGTLSTTIGVSATGGLSAEVVSAQIGVNVAASASLTVSATATVSNPTPKGQYYEYGASKRYEYTGATAQYGPDGIISSGTATNYQYAPGDYVLEIGEGGAPPTP